MSGHTSVWGWVLLILAGCGGGGEQPEATPSPAEPEVQVLFPSVDGGERATVTELLDPPPPPDGVQLVGKVYEVSVPDTAPLPARVLIPASPELLSMADEYQVLLGRHNGQSWDLIAASVIDGNVVAEVDHFTPIAVFTRPLGDGGETSWEELVGERPLVVSTPDLKWLVVEGGTIYAELDLTPSKYATVSNVEGGDYVIPLQGIEINVSFPVLRSTGAPVPSARDSSFEVLDVDGRTYIDLTNMSDTTLSHYRITLTPPERFDYGALLTQNSARPAGDKFLDGETTPSLYGTWIFRARPVFNDATAGELSAERVYLPVSVADTYLRLRQGLASRLGAGLANGFLVDTANQPFLIPYQKGWPDSYNAPLLWDEQARLALWGVDKPLIGMSQVSEWARVVTHEWGHYASHVLLGDEWVKAVGSGYHTGWQEAASRELAWAEDIATFLGQWAINENVTLLPEAAGAMKGVMSQDSQSHYSQHPETVDDSGNTDDYWPNNRDMDAPRVEAVSATILSRLAQHYGFSAVMEVIVASRPVSLLAFVSAWQGRYGETSAEAIYLQQLCFDEGLKWKWIGRVVDEADEKGLVGVVVTISNLVGDVVGGGAVTDGDGVFSLDLPPGKVEIKFRHDLYDSLDDRVISPDTSRATNESSPEVVSYRMKHRVEVGAVVSDFDSSLAEQEDRWGIGAMTAAYGMSWFHGSDVATYRHSGGNPDGYISWLGDQGDWWFFVTSSNRYVGDRSFALNKTLSFDLRTEYGWSEPSFFIPFVVISGHDAQGQPLHLFQPQSAYAIPGTDWTSYQIPLSQSAQWQLSSRNDLSSAVVADEEQIRQVLSTLSSLRIRGEFGNWRYRGDLDNVVLGR